MSSTARAKIPVEREHASAGVEALEPADRRVERVLQILRHDYHRCDIRLEDLAREVGLSIWHLSHLFKSQTGDSPAHYLKTVRLERACELLAATDLSVKEVMHKVGLADQSHFAKDFKKAYGITPTEYRQTLRESGYRHQSQTDTRRAAPA